MQPPYLLSETIVVVTSGSLIVLPLLSETILMVVTAGRLAYPRIIRFTSLGLERASSIAQLPDNVRRMIHGRGRNVDNRRRLMYELYEAPQVVGVGMCRECKVGRCTIRGMGMLALFQALPSRLIKHARRMFDPRWCTHYKQVFFLSLLVNISGPKDKASLDCLRVLILRTVFIVWLWTGTILILTLRSHTTMFCFMFFFVPPVRFV